MPEKKKRKSQKGYWIMFYEGYCGVCGGLRYKEQERIFDRPKPKYWHERHEVDENYVCYGCY